MYKFTLTLYGGHMSAFLLFWMVAAIFVHNFLNFFLKIVSLVTGKATSTAAVEYSVEEAFAKVFAGILNFFKGL